MAEDILREATALTERVELQTPIQPEPIIVGFRKNGSASFFFGSELVLQFNGRGELRRAYDQGQLLKSVGGQLIGMHRVHTEHEVILQSRELTAQERADFCHRSLELLKKLRGSLSRGTFQQLRQVPESGNIVARVAEWVQSHGDQLVIADRPHAA